MIFRKAKFRTTVREYICRRDFLKREIDVYLARDEYLWLISAASLASFQEGYSVFSSSETFYYFSSTDQLFIGPSTLDHSTTSLSFETQIFTERQAIPRANWIFHSLLHPLSQGRYARAEFSTLAYEKSTPASRTVHSLGRNAKTFHRENEGEITHSNRWTQNKPTPGNRRSSLPTLQRLPNAIRLGILRRHNLTYTRAKKKSSERANDCGEERNCELKKANDRTSRTSFDRRAGRRYSRYVQPINVRYQLLQPRKAFAREMRPSTLDIDAFSTRFVDREIFPRRLEIQIRQNETRNGTAATSLRQRDNCFSSLNWCTLVQ